MIECVQMTKVKELHGIHIEIRTVSCCLFYHKRWSMWPLPSPINKLNYFDIGVMCWVWAPFRWQSLRDKFVQLNIYSRKEQQTILLCVILSALGVIQKECVKMIFFEEYAFTPYASLFNFFLLCSIELTWIDECFLLHSKTASIKLNLIVYSTNFHKNYDHINNHSRAKKKRNFNSSQLEEGQNGNVPQLSYTVH